MCCPPAAKVLRVQFEKRQPSGGRSMNNRLAANRAQTTFIDKLIRRGRVAAGPVAPPLELNIERAPQGSRRCRPCAAVCGRYDCRPSAAVHGQWRHTGAGRDLTVRLVRREPGGDSRLHACIVVESEGRAHARAVYSSEPLSNGPFESPCVLKLIYEESECGFVFPGQVDVVSIGVLCTH
jgi:hypothetical protein